MSLDDGDAWIRGEYGSHCRMPYDGLRRAYRDARRCLAALAELSMIVRFQVHGPQSEEELSEDGFPEDPTSDLRETYSLASESVHFVEEELAAKDDSANVCGVEADSVHAAVVSLAKDALSIIDGPSGGNGASGQNAVAIARELRVLLKPNELRVHTKLEREYLAAKERRWTAEGPPSRCQLASDLRGGLLFLLDCAEHEATEFYWDAYSNWLTEELMRGACHYTAAPEANQLLAKAMDRWQGGRSNGQSAGELNALIEVYTALLRALASDDAPARSFPPDQSAAMRQAVQNYRKRRFGEPDSLKDDLSRAHDDVRRCFCAMDFIGGGACLNYMCDGMKGEQLANDLWEYWMHLGYAKTSFVAVEREFSRVINSKVTLCGVEADSLHAAVLMLAEDVARKVVAAMKGSSDGEHLTQENCYTIVEAFPFFDDDEVRSQLGTEYDACRQARGDGGAAESDAGLDTQSIRRTVSVAEANAKAMELANADPSFLERTARHWAAMIGCSPATIVKTRLWQVTVRRTGRSRTNGPRTMPSVFPLTSQTLAREGKEDAELQRLIGEQEADFEPSPLEDDPPGLPRRVRERKDL